MCELETDFKFWKVCHMFWLVSKVIFQLRFHMMQLTKQRVSMAISLSKIHRHMQIGPQRANERRKFHTNVTWSLELLQEVIFGKVQTPRKRRRDNSQDATGNHTGNFCGQFNFWFKTYLTPCWWWLHRLEFFKLLHWPIQANFSQSCFSPILG